MNQTDRKPDRVTKASRAPIRNTARRIYSTAEIYIYGFVSFVGFAMAALVIVWTLIVLRFCTEADPCVPMQEVFRNTAPWVGSGVFAGIWGFVGCRWAKQDVLHCTPLFHEQVSTLPANDILLRSSNAATAPDHALLRAAHAGAPTPVVELLRPQPDV